MELKITALQLLILLMIGIRFVLLKIVHRFKISSVLIVVPHLSSTRFLQSVQVSMVLTLVVLLLIL